MWQANGPYGIDATIHQARCLLEKNQIDRLQALLLRLAPAWASGLHTFVSEEKRSDVIGLGTDDALWDVIRHRILNKSELYVKLGGQPGDIIGNVEFRGSHDDLIVLISVDERPFFRRAHEWSFGNYITFQVRTADIEGMPAHTWTRNAFEALVVALDPVYGMAHSCEEYDYKNMWTEGGLWAIGRDISRYLPGIYWLNFFGKPYCDLIGKEKLLTAPAHETKGIGSGVLLGLSADPFAWDTENYRQVENAVLDHSGERFFFSREEPNRKTIAPDFGLPTDPCRQG